MGCGQSHIGNIIYPRKSKNKEGSKRNGDGSGDEEEDKDEDADSESEETRLRLKQLVQVPPAPLLDHSEISSSQSDFFKMLDEKIANGPDYDSDCEYERAMEHARLCRLLQDWQVAKERSRYRYTSRYAKPQQQPLRYIPMNGGPHYHHPPQYQVHYQYQHYPHHYPVVNSVVTYDYDQDAYYTKLA